MDFLYKSVCGKAVKNMIFFHCKNMEYFVVLSYQQLIRTLSTLFKLIQGRLLYNLYPSVNPRSFLCLFLFFSRCA